MSASSSSRRNPSIVGRTWSDGRRSRTHASNLASMSSRVTGLLRWPRANSARCERTRPSASVTVTVLNGGETDGAAAAATSTLSGLGFGTGTAGSADTRLTTTIEYPTGMEAQAKALAAYVPGAIVDLSTSVSGVTLILGNDGLTVTPPSTGAEEGGSSGSDSSSAAEPPASAQDSPARNFAAGSCIN